MLQRSRLFLTTSAAVATGAAAAFTAAALWDRATRRAVARLRADELRHPSTYSPDAQTDLPDPVARFFRFALAPGRPLVRHARIEHRGKFRTALDKPAVRFTSEHHVSARPAGFVWDARIHMMPLLPVRVRDSFYRGTGTMLAKIGALVPVADQSGTPEMAMSSLQRLLAELAWLPTALLPDETLSWNPIDDRSARATLSASSVTVSADFHFASDGRIDAVTAMRYRDVDGRPVLTPFEGRHFDYRRYDGMMIPTRGEVSWTLPEGRLTYWRGTLVLAEYE